jgi:tetratricopeptide (TPR) repeat protein
MNLALGKLYYHAGLKRNAVTAYKDALKQNPYALEAIQVLLQLGVSATEVNSFYGTSSSNPAVVQDGVWIQKLVEAHASATHYQQQRAISLFTTLERRFPSNLHCTLHIGRLQLELMDLEEALYAFKRARVVDELNLDMMDR